MSRYHWWILSWLNGIPTWIMTAPVMVIFHQNTESVTMAAVEVTECTIRAMHKNHSTVTGNYVSFTQVDP